MKNMLTETESNLCNDLVTRQF